MAIKLAEPPLAPHGKTLGPPPARRPHSLRRTSSAQAHWPSGISERYELISRARDLHTGENAASTAVAASEDIVSTLTMDGIVESIRASIRSAELAALAGRRVGGPLRKAVTEAMPEEPENSTLLYRMIDDMAGGAFLAPASWQSWLDDGIGPFFEAIGKASVMKNKMEGMCVSYKPGSPALLPDGRQDESFSDRSIGLVAVGADDPYQWHDLETFAGPNESRLRYMDVWRESGAVQVLFGFQDSSAFPGTELRRLFHEYRGLAVVDPDTMVLERIEVEFGSLPYTTCHAAASTPQQLVGRSVEEFRRTVIDVLPGIAGCTHLNDCLRTLQDVPAMVRILDRMESDA